MKLNDSELFKGMLFKCPYYVMNYTAAQSSKYHEEIQKTGEKMHGL